MDPFRDLYERYYRDVYRFALFLTGDVARAEDLTADTFVRAWTARDRIRHETVRAYLLTIARNLYRDSLRSMRGSSASRVTVVLALVFGTIAVGSAITWLIARTRSVGAALS
jgi:RNA polymerase sigma factor (sigma-70 family)